MNDKERENNLLLAVGHYAGYDSETYKWVKQQLKDGRTVDELVTAMTKELRKPKVN